MSSGLIESMQDMGAAGITSSSVEMASKGNVGVNINLDKVPLRQPLTPYEILLSESQERMLAVINKDDNEKIKKILKKWQIDYEVIGEVTNTKRVVFTSKEKIVVDLPVDIIVDDAPEYDREFSLPKKRKNRNFNNTSLSVDKIISNYMNNLNYLDKSWVYSQYDSTVMGETIKEPGQSSGVVKIQNTDKAIGATTDCNPLYIRINPERGMIYTVLEAYRNLIASNIKPMAITNNLNFASPLDPNIMGEIVLSISGLSNIAKKLDTPIVSGNVSLYNQTNDRPINPTPVIGMVGCNLNWKKLIQNKFISEDDELILLGNSLGVNFSPYYLQDQKIVSSTCEYNELLPPDIDLEIKTAKFIQETANKDLIQSSNDISRGGVFMSLMKMTYKNLGFSIMLDDDDIFCEYSAGYILAVHQKNKDEIINLLNKEQINFLSIGQVKRDTFEINSKKLNYSDMIEKYYKNFANIIN